jgi:hypothetical protein
MYINANIAVLLRSGMHHKLPPKALKRLNSILHQLSTEGVELAPGQINEHEKPTLQKCAITSATSFCTFVPTRKKTEKKVEKNLTTYGKPTYI